MNARYILIAVVVAFGLGGGVFVWQYFGAGEGEIEVQKSDTKEQVIQNETTEWQTYQNTKFNFSLRHPPEWNITEKEMKLYTEQDSFILTIQNAAVPENPKVRVELNGPGVGYEYLRRSKTESKIIDGYSVEFIYADALVDFALGCGDEGVYTLRGFLENNEHPQDLWLLWGIACQNNRHISIFEQILSTFRFVE